MPGNSYSHHIAYTAVSAANEPRNTRRHSLALRPDTASHIRLTEESFLKISASIAQYMLQNPKRRIRHQSTYVFCSARASRLPRSVNSAKTKPSTAAGIIIFLPEQTAAAEKRKYSAARAPSSSGS